jgi:RNA polymerase sigma factor (sigma-70 family)
MKSVMTEQTTASTLEKAGDHQLTRQFVEDRSEEAFRVIVSRYVNLVYSTGLRMVGDSHLADDVTQAVFIVFARKADSLKKKTVFASWFYRTTRFVAADLLRSENRRQDRERKAAEMNAINESANDPGWSDLAPELDRLMGRLGEKDRTAVVLRYFQQMESAEAAKVMGISEPALRKRLSRAVEKLRLLFKQRGIVAPAAALAAFLTADGAQAAPAVVIEGVAGSVTGGAATDAGLGLADAGLRSLKLAKLKLVAMWGLPPRLWPLSPRPRLTARWIGCRLVRTCSFIRAARIGRSPSGRCITWRRHWRPGIQTRSWMDLCPSAANRILPCCP